MKNLSLVLTLSLCLMAPSLAIKETAQCFKGEKVIGDVRLVESSWTFHSPQSSSREHNQDYCNIYEISCQGECKTELQPAKWVDPNLPF